MNGALKSNRGWRIVRGILIALAALATLVAAFYTEEDWRGKRAWENCKRELEAQGVELDWNKFLPPVVPDDQNFYTANTNILTKFKQITGTNDPNYKAAVESSWLDLRVISCPTIDSLDGKLTVARIIPVSKAPVSDSRDTNTLAVDLNDPAAVNHVRDFITAVIGPRIEGAMGMRIYRNELKSIRPAQIYTVATTPPSYSLLEQMIPPGVRLTRPTPIYQVATASNAPDHDGFNVQFVRTYPIGGQMVEAVDYLKWSDQFVPAFDEIREALKRPYAILPGDYSNPTDMPIPNFVTVRALALTLAQRAQCDLLLGHSDKALRELTLIHDVCRILQKPEVGHPETLIEAMINVAVTSVYVNVIEEGLQRHAWQEPQLITLQKQLKDTDIRPFLVEAMREQPAHISRLAEMTTPPVWESLRPFRWAVPRGWVYQMVAVAVKLECKTMAGFNLENSTISPQKVNETMHDINQSLDSGSPFNLLARIMVPNYARAWQTTAYDQTLVNEAQIACALERYHLIHGEYPETLDTLTPQFIETIPRDLIGGQLLHYRRTPDGNFLLYSVGWNETDDGGQKPPHNLYSVTDYTKGDWVWGK